MGDGPLSSSEGLVDDAPAVGWTVGLPFCPSDSLWERSPAARLPCRLSWVLCPEMTLANFAPWGNKCTRSGLSAPGRQKEWARLVSVSKTLVRGRGVACLLDSPVISGEGLRWKLFTGPVFTQPGFS